MQEPPGSAAGLYQVSLIMTHSAFEHAGDIYSKAPSISLFQAKALDKSLSAAEKMQF
jgi:hypothetical protein